MRERERERVVEEFLKKIKRKSPSERKPFVVERKSWKELLIKIEEVDLKREEEKVGRKYFKRRIKGIRESCRKFCNCSHRS